jgi:hypothetical protein
MILETYLKKDNYFIDRYSIFVKQPLSLRAFWGLERRNCSF